MANDMMVTEESFIKKGRMVKSPSKMQPKELEEWEEKEKAYVRNYLFSIGQPLVYQKNGKMLAEYADGRIVNL